MADLGNLKIKDTYQLLLQTDAGGNLQKLDGSSPNPFIINQNLRYLDGTTHPSGFVLTSDGSGNASWSAVAFSGDVYISGGSIEGTTIELNASSGGTVSVPGLSWSSSTSGHISNSGLTSNVGIGTSTPNKPLTVVGDVSGTTDLYIDGNMYSGTTNLLDIFASSGITNQDVYWSANTDGSISPSGLTTTVQTEGDLRVSGTVYTNTITTTATSTDTLTIQSDTIQIKSHGGSAEYLNIADDRFSFHFDGSESVSFQGPNYGSAQYLFNAGGQDIDFKISGPTISPVFHVYVSENRIRIKDHLTIGPNSSVSHADAVKWGLAVTGSSLFYSGGTSIAGNAITAVGDISGTTDLYIGDNIRGLRGQFGNLPSAAGANRDLEIKGDDSVYLRLQSTTNSSQFIEFLNDQEPDFLIYNKHSDGGLHIASEDKSFLIIGANDGDTIDLYGNTTISGNTTLSGNTSYSGTISGTGSVTAIGGFVGEVTGNAATATKIASITNANIVQLAGAQTLTGTKTLNSFKGTGGATVTNILDEDAMGSNSATALATQQSIKAYADTKSPIAGSTDLVTVGTVVTGTWASNRKFVRPGVGVASSGGADIVYFPDDITSTIPGAIYYFNGVAWETSDANFLVSSSGLTAVALGENTASGMLIRGMVTLAVSPGGVDGNVVYLSEAASKLTTAPPTTSAAIVRVMGYAVDTSAKSIWFDPDKTWVELS